jgi:hypothetical protein
MNNHQKDQFLEDTVQPDTLSPTAAQGGRSPAPGPCLTPGELVDFLLRDLTEEVPAVLSQHLAQCTCCQREMAMLLIPFVPEVLLRPTGESATQDDLYSLRN